MLSKDEIKKKLGFHAAGLVSNDQTFGLGTGTTIFWLIQALGDRVKTGERFTIIPTSSHTEQLALDEGLQVLSLNEIDRLDFTIDGADEIDQDLNLIKGGGGALLQEKMVAAASARLIIIADQEKFVPQLGGFLLPVEVVISGWKQVHMKILAAGCPSADIRLKDGQPLITDNGHHILDCNFEHITDPYSLNMQLHLIPGIVETGLFVQMADTVILGDNNGIITTKNQERDLENNYFGRHGV